jgi:hypothetical protein
MPHACLLSRWRLWPALSLIAGPIRRVASGSNANGTTYSEAVVRVSTAKPNAIPAITSRLLTLPGSREHEQSSSGCSM